jgi:hypothetical protein
MEASYDRRLPDLSLFRQIRSGVDPAHREAVNFYIWESADAARLTSDEKTLERVTALYRVRPTVDVVEIPALIDNAAADRGRGAE